MKPFGILFATLFTLSAPSTFALTLKCTAEGKTFGIVKVVAESQGSSGNFVSKVTVRDSSGKLTELAPTLGREGLMTGINLAPDFERGPFGIKQAFLVNENDAYRIEARTYCNFYYQEETCLDGDLLSNVIDRSIKCTAQ